MLNNVALLEGRERMGGGGTQLAQGDTCEREREGKGGKGRGGTKNDFFKFNVFGPSFHSFQWLNTKSTEERFIPLNHSLHVHIYILIVIFLAVAIIISP